MAAQNDLPEVQLDLKALYREDVFTDRRAGSIRRLTPVTADGSVDPSRPVLFSGQTQLLTPAGVLPPRVASHAGTPAGGVKEFSAGGADTGVSGHRARERVRELLRDPGRGSLPLARESRLALGARVGDGAERAVATAAGGAAAACLAEGAPHAAVELRALRRAGEARRTLFLSAQRRPAESARAVGVRQPRGARSRAVR